MIIGISSEMKNNNESATIQKLLCGGMDLFHIRKYDYSDKMLVDLTEKIDRKFRGRLVLHSHFYLAEELQINRLHINEKLRKTGFEFVHSEFVYSTSVHSIEDFNQLSSNWEYAFLSPVFPSISKKGYGTDKNVFEEIKNRTNTVVKLIGLGGVQQENYKKLRNQGADGAALLGSIWQHPHPLKTIRKCKQIDQLF